MIVISKRRIQFSFHITYAEIQLDSSITEYIVYYIYTEYDGIYVVDYIFRGSIVRWTLSTYIAHTYLR